MYKLKLVCKHCFNDEFLKNYSNEYMCSECCSVYKEVEELFVMDYKLEEKQPRIYERWLKE